VIPITVSEIQEIRSGCVVEAVSQILARCILCVYKNNDDELGAADVSPLWGAADVRDAGYVNLA